MGGELLESAFTFLYIAFYIQMEDQTGGTWRSADFGQYNEHYVGHGVMAAYVGER